MTIARITVSANLVVAAFAWMVSVVRLALSVRVRTIALATEFAIQAPGCAAVHLDSSSSIAVSNHVSTIALTMAIATTELATALKDISPKIVPCASVCPIAPAMASVTITRALAPVLMVGNGQIVREDSASKVATTAERAKTVSVVASLDGLDMRASSWPAIHLASMTDFALQASADARPSGEDRNARSEHAPTAARTLIMEPVTACWACVCA